MPAQTNTESTTSPVKLGDVSIINHILENGLVNEKGQKISFDERQFLIEPYRDMSPLQVYKKCVQIGMSTTMVVKTLYVAEHAKFNIIYTLPTDNDVSEFVSSKTNKIIQANPVYQNLRTDNIERKEIGDRFIYYKGTISKTGALMTSADLLVHDEKDRSDLNRIKDYGSRTKASSYKGVWELSNPSIEKQGVDVTWRLSDQKEWTIECHHCGLEQIMKWPDNIDLKSQDYICQRCKRTLSKIDRTFGKWVPQSEGKWSGYHISLLMAPWIEAGEIIEESQGDLEYFNNFILGETYNPGNLQVSRGIISDSWTPQRSTLQSGEQFMGVDVGNVKHYAVGNAKGIHTVGTFADWEDLNTMLDFYQPVMVIDAMPDNTMSKYYVENYSNAYMSYFKRDRERLATVSWGEGDNQGIVYSDRNRVIDQLINDIIEGKVLFAMPNDLVFKDYIRHWESLRRIKNTNTMGIEHYEWESTNNVDHYVFATLYWYLATMASGTGRVFTEANSPQTKLVQDTVDGPVVGDLKRIFDEGGVMGSQD